MVDSSGNIIRDRLFRYFPSATCFVGWQLVFVDELIDNFGTTAENAGGIRDMKNFFINIHGDQLL